MKTKNKNENEKQKEIKNKNENENEFSSLFSFCFSFSFWFLLLLCKSFCIFVNSTWPRGAIDSQLSLDWPTSVIAFLLNPRGLEVLQTVNSLLLGLQVPQYFHLRIFHVAQRCHSWSTLSWLAQKCYSTQKYGTSLPFWTNLVEKNKIISLN